MAFVEQQDSVPADEPEGQSGPTLDYVAALVEAVPDAVKAKTLEGTLTYWNLAAEHLYGYTAAEVLGRNVALVFPPDRLDELSGVLGRVRRGETVDPYETERVRKDGRRIPVTVSSAPIRDSAGTIVGAVTVARALTAADVRFGQLLESAPDGMALVDSDATILLVNTQLEQLFGYTRGQLVGQPIEVLVPEAIREAHRADRLAYAVAPHRRPMGLGLTLRGLRQDGSQVPVEISLSPLATATGLVTIASVRDMTASHAARDQEHQLTIERAAQGRAALVAEASHVFAQTGVDREQLLKAIARQVALGIGDVCVVTLLSPERSAAATAIEHRDPESSAQANALASELLSRGGDNLLDAAAFLERLGLHDGLVVSLESFGRNIGTLGVARDSPGRGYRADDKALLEELANRAAVAIENARLFLEAREQAEVHVSLNAELRALAESERVARERAALLQNLAAALSASRTSENVAAAIVQEGLAVVGASAGAVLTLGPDRATLDLLAARGYPPDLADWMRRLELTSGVALTYAARTNTPVWLATPEAIRTGFPHPAPLPASTGSAAHVVLPLTANDAVFGVLAMSFAEARYFGHEDRAVLTTAAQLCAQALDRARLHDAERRASASAQAHADRTARLQMVTAALGGAVTSSAVAEVITGQGVNAIGGNACLVATIADDGEEMTVIGATGYPREILDAWRHFPVSADVPLAEAARSGETVLLTSPEERAARYPSLSPTLPALGFRAWAVFPLLVDGRTLGALGFNWPEPRQFSADERAFMQALAQQCAQALERARLREVERAAAQRTTTLAAASAALAGSLDYETTLGQVAALVVPTLADWCAVDLLTEEGGLRRVAVVHADPSRAEAATRLQQQFEWLPPTATHTALRVARSGEPWFDPSIDEERFVTEARSPEHLAVLRQLGFTGEIVVPLTAHGRALGSLTLVAADHRRRFTAEDVELAVELARRCADAIDNARLHGQARAAIEARDEFVAVAAHDLRAPLAAMRGFAQLALRQLAAGTADAQVVGRALSEVEEQTRRADRLIARLLEAARLEGGTVQLQRTRVDVAHLSAQVVAGFQVAHPNRAIELRSPGPTYAEVDPARLEQVLANLIDNALKFSPPDSAVEVEVDGRLPGSVRISISDHGRGIPIEQRPRVFERFYQAHESGHPGGVGLGLYISRRLIELHGGTIDIETAERGGTRFVILLSLPPDLVLTRSDGQIC